MSSEIRQALERIAETPTGCLCGHSQLAAEALSNPVRGEEEKAIVDCERCDKTLERIGNLRGADYWLCDCSVRETTNYGSQRYEVVRADEGLQDFSAFGDGLPADEDSGGRSRREIANYEMGVLPADEDSQGEGHWKVTNDWSGDEHGPDLRRCDDCGNPIMVAWYAPNWLWNEVIGGPAAEYDPGGAFCPPCFDLRAAQQDKVLIWRADIPGVMETALDLPASPSKGSE